MAEQKRISKRATRRAVRRARQERRAMAMWDDDYDPPLISDADIEMAEWEAESRRAAAARRAGRCTHGGVTGHVSPAVYHVQDYLKPGEMCCWYCGRIFTSHDEWMDAIQEAING